MRTPHVLVHAMAWTALVATVYLGSAGVRSEPHARASAALEELRARQAAFDATLLELRAGSAAARSSLLERFGELESSAHSIPRSIDLERHTIAAHALSGYVDALRGARRRVERLAAITARPDSPTDARRARAEVEQELAAVERLGLGGAARSLSSGYAASFGARLDEAETFRIALFLVTALLLIRALRAASEVERRSAEVRAANRTLEARVEERTRRLSEANKALESAIEEAHRCEQDARVARESAEAANRGKSSFLAHMSHEIRSPMTAILGYSERLLEGSLSEGERAEALSAIRRNGEHLAQLVDDVLDLSKIEAGQVVLERAPCAPGRLVVGVREALAPRAEAKGLEFQVLWEGPAPATVLTDLLRVEQVLFNLVGNAIKFTAQGRVTVRARYEPPARAGSGGRLAFAVEDSGIGMDQEAAARVFRPYVQASTSTTRRFGGTGLGLAICRRLVSALGGAIRVESRLGHGSVFSFHVDAGPLDGPLGAVDLGAAQEPASAPESLAGLRVLLAEDGEDTRRLLTHFLSAAGAQVTTAADGEEAVRSALAARAEGAPFDVVLMDMEMPRVDGVEAVRRLRSAGYDLPVVALTANVLVSDRRRCLEAGCDDYCTKPVRRATLLWTAARWRRVDPVEDAGPAGPRGGAAASADEGLLELVRLFVQELDGDVESMRRALAGDDLADLSILAHRLKGAAGSYGFPAITRQAALLESAARGGAPRDTLSSELAALEALCTQARGNPRVAPA
ncbi:MAG: response regulator [Planctomycetes bacterium]|nr:response regulator [Planctomycetota bacterium]